MSVCTFVSIVFASEPKLRRTSHRVELVGHRAQEAALPGHPRVVVRRLAGADVGERLAAVEAVGAAGNDVDSRLALAPGGPRDLVDEPFLHVDLDAAERVDEVGEAEQVDERVVVDPKPEQLRDRLLERRCALLAAAEDAVERVRSSSVNGSSSRPASERHLGEVARDAERDRRAGAVLRGDEDDRVRAGADVARPFVGAEQQDRRPGLRVSPASRPRARWPSARAAPPRRGRAAR